MLVSTAVTQIKRQFGDEYAVLVTDSDIFNWIHEAQLDILRRTGQNQQSVVTTVSAFPVQVPDAVNIKRVSIDGLALVNISREEVDLHGISTTNTGAPRFWYRDGDSIRLFPQDASDTRQIVIHYSKIPTLLTSVNSSFAVPEVYHTDIVHYCLARAHNKNENYSAEKVEMEHYERNVGSRGDESYSADTAQYKLPDLLDYDYYG